MRSHSSDFVKLDPPILEYRMSNEFGKALILDGEDSRNNKRRRLADFCDQILNLTDSSKVFVICAVLGNLQGRVVIDAFHLLLELFLKIEKPSQCLSRFPHPAFPLFKLRILTL